MSATDAAVRPLQEIRDEDRRERLELRIAENRAKRKLLQESWGYGLLGPSATGPWGELVDPLDRFRDGDRLLYPPGAYQDRRDGRNDPFVRSEQELAFVRGMARWVVVVNDFACGALETLVDFIVGEGMTFRATSKDEAPPKLVAACQDTIDGFVDQNNFDEWQQELVRRVPRDGEYALRLFPKQDGTTTVRTIEPDYITAAGSGDEADSFGVLTDPDDVETVEGLRVKYRPEEESEDLGPEEFVYVKNPAVDRTIKRGLSDFFATGEALEGARKLLRNLREGAAIQAAIAGIRQHEMAGKDNVEAMRDEIKTRLNRTDPATGRTIKYQKFEPGTVMDIPKGLTYVAPPWMNTGAPNQIQILQAALRSAATRWGMPEFMISADASNNNYASILVAGAPFVRRVKRLQKFHKRRFLDLIWRALDNAADAGKLQGFSREEVRALIEVQCEAPAPEVANEREQAETDWGDMDRGVLSTQTRQQRRGLDSEQEQKNLAEKPMTRAPGQLTDIDPAGNPIDPSTEQDQGGGRGAGGGLFPATESLTRRRHGRLKKRYGEKIAEAIAASARQLLEGCSRPFEECGGEGGKPGPCPTGGGNDVPKGDYEGHFKAAGAAMTAAHPMPKPLPPGPPGMGRPDLVAKSPELQAAVQQRDEYSAKYWRARTAAVVDDLLNEPQRLTPQKPDASDKEKEGRAVRAVEQVSDAESDLFALHDRWKHHHEAVVASHPDGQKALDAAKTEATRRYQAALANAEAHVAALPERIRAKALRALEKAKLHEGYEPCLQECDQDGPCEAADCRGRTSEGP